MLFLLITSLPLILNNDKEKVKEFTFGFDWFTNWKQKLFKTLSCILILRKIKKVLTTILNQLKIKSEGSLV